MLDRMSSINDLRVIMDEKMTFSDYVGRHGCKDLRVHLQKFGLEITLECVEKLRLSFGNFVLSFTYSTFSDFSDNVENLRKSVCNS
jgi:hypothetical protein